MTSKHPMLKQVKELIDARNSFDVRVSGHVDKKLLRSIMLLNNARKSILEWPPQVLNTSSSLKSILTGLNVANLLTEAGKRSIPYFAIHARQRRAKIGMLTDGEFRSIERHLLYPQLGPILRMLRLGPHVALANDEINQLTCHIKSQHSVVSIVSLSSKSLRENMIETDPICIFKLGPILTPGELLSWTRKTRKLTSTRHRNILLRAMHGDVFSNERLHRFGLKDSPACANCDEPIETRQHRLVECEKAQEAWRELEATKALLTLRTLSDFSVENLVGAKDPLNKLELALQAELILKLSTKSGAYCPKQLVRAAVLMVCNSEKLERSVQEKFERFKNSR